MSTKSNKTSKNSNHKKGNTPTKIASKKIVKVTKRAPTAVTAKSSAKKSNLKPRLQKKAASVATKKTTPKKPQISVKKPAKNRSVKKPSKSIVPKKGNSVVNKQLKKTPVKSAKKTQPKSEKQSLKKSQPLKQPKKQPQKKLEKQLEKKPGKQVEKQPEKLTKKLDEKQTKTLGHLVEKAQEQGYITYNEINETIPPEITDPEQIEDIISYLSEDVGIPISSDENKAVLLAEPSVTSDEHTESAVSPPSTLPDEETARSSDPVRIYMREMGTAKLLTRAGEIVIAKKIEDGIRMTLEAFGKYPGIIENILEDYEKYKNGTKRLQDIITGFYNADDTVIPENYKARLLLEKPFITPQQDAQPIVVAEESEHDVSTREAGIDHEHGETSSDVEEGEEGPDPMLAAYRFTILKELHDKYIKTEEKHGKNNANTKKTPSPID